ncbi:VOC family protein [Streptomyces sp. NPDC021096]|uniref:VOC family protein n=1 Tax=Streptomyces sp. NPDC021096 TaxID=3154792 RepID=UPI0034081F90
MTSLVRNISFDCAPPHEPYALARFWSEVLGHPVDPEGAPGGDEVGLVTPEGQPDLLFLRVPEAKTLKNRVHLDLQPDGPREAEVERVVALGATVVDDRRRPDGTGWVVLADPAGNEFCVERSAAERAATQG